MPTSPFSEHRGRTQSRLDQRSRQPSRNRSYSRSRNRNRRHTSYSRSRDRSYSGNLSSKEWGRSNRSDQLGKAKDVLKAYARQSSLSPVSIESKNVTNKPPAPIIITQSGKLAEEQNTVKGIVLKYTEPEDARMPTEKFALVVFKGNECLDTIYLHKQSCYLLGRERKIVDIPTDHLSCSKQHAVIQFRQSLKNGVQPYLLDIESTNGTYLNSERLEHARFYQLRPKDIIRLGESTREYVFIQAPE